MTISMKRLRRTLLPAALISSLAIAAPVVAQGEGPRPPLDYRSQAGKLSQPIYPTTIKETFYRTMADGERVYVEVVRPDPDEYPDLGTVPVILEAAPYHGTIATRIGDRIFPDPRQGNTPLGLTGYFAPRGYAVAMMDLRGTGKSSGCLDHLAEKDASDMKAVIEWLAAEPWSNGRVGMAGHSYVGATQAVAAAVKPKGLVTITPSAGLASMYDHQFQAGVPWLAQWVGPMVAYEALAIVRDLPPGFTEPILTGSPTGDNWENGPNPQAGCGMKNSAILAGTGQATGQYELWHGQRDWRAAAADADIPIFMIHGVNDNAARIPASEWFFNRRFARDGDKVWIGQWDHGSTNGRCASASGSRVSHPNCRFLQWQYALHAWFDHHLQQRTWIDEEGNEHPIDTGPAVEAFTNGEEAISVGPSNSPGGTPLAPEEWDTRVFTDDAWKKHARVALYPDASDMSLSFDRPGTEATVTYSGADAWSLLVAVPKIHVGENPTFTSAPFEEDTLLLGTSRLRLEASVTANAIQDITAEVVRVAPSGDRAPIDTCAIRPALRHGVEQLSPVIPGDRMTLNMTCFTVAHWIPEGHRLELVLSTSTRHHASTGGEAQITVFTGGSDGSVYLPPKVGGGFTLFDDVPLR